MYMLCTLSSKIASHKLRKLESYCCKECGLNFPYPSKLERHKKSRSHREYCSFLQNLSGGEEVMSDQDSIVELTSPDATVISEHVRPTVCSILIKASKLSDFYYKRTVMGLLG